MARRTVTAVVLLALLLPVIYFGGIPYFLLVAVFVGIGSGSTPRCSYLRGFQPSRVITIGGVLLILAARGFWPSAAASILTLCILAALAFHLYMFERGADGAAVDLAITLSGLA